MHSVTRTSAGSGSRSWRTSSSSKASMLELSKLLRNKLQNPTIIIKARAYLLHNSSILLQLCTKSSLGCSPISVILAIFLHNLDNFELSNRRCDGSGSISELAGTCGSSFQNSDDNLTRFPKFSLTVKLVQTKSSKRFLIPFLDEEMQSTTRISERGLQQPDSNLKNMINPTIVCQNLRKPVPSCSILTKSFQKQYGKLLSEFEKNISKLGK